MLTLQFPGADKLVATVDEAVSQPGEAAITDSLRRSLCRLIRGREVELPACVFETASDHYARRELYVSDAHGYSVVAMTWGPGQGTPIHDHSGMWCVEGVWRGQLEICQYELLEHAGERFRFRPVGTIQAGSGSAGSLIPPHEYHTIGNPSDEAVAVSLHIYRGCMTCCSVFRPAGSDWYQREPCQLGLDRVA
ncbi:MAG TPA: cysteine dioxygenase family protein [Xanthomonadaceae bacterium]|nr:cysteine dioxygenase family protein [Xanthomonadaceae bacterium]